MKRTKIIIVITGFIISCVTFICLAYRTSLIFVGNSYEKGEDINVTITLNDTEVLYDGFLRSHDLPFLLKEMKMQMGLYKITAYLEPDDKKVETVFFYFYQKTIWIDFDMTQKNPLLVLGYYKQVPL